MAAAEEERHRRQCHSKCAKEFPGRPWDGVAERLAFGLRMRTARASRKKRHLLLEPGGANGRTLNRSSARD